MLNKTKYQIIKILTIMLLFITNSTYGQNVNCNFATPFIDNYCVPFLPPTAGPVTRCYSFMAPDDSILFVFTPYAPIGTCLDAISQYTLYDELCNPIDTSLFGSFTNLTIDNNYVICFTVQCPTDGEVNLLCTQELIILPIELTDFRARIEYDKIRLIWKTASETNNDVFNVYTSSDFVNWKVIGKVDGAGNSTTEMNYSFLYSQPLDGVNYFKLEQVDNDGLTNIVSTIAVSYIKKYKAYDIFGKYNILGQEK